MTSDGLRTLNPYRASLKPLTSLRRPGTLWPDRYLSVQIAQFSRGNARCERPVAARQIGGFSAFSCCPRGSVRPAYGLGDDTAAGVPELAEDDVVADCVVGSIETRSVVGVAVRLLGTEHGAGMAGGGSQRVGDLPDGLDPLS